MAKPSTPLLSPRHRAFVDAYVANGGNGAAAARSAGFGTKNARFESVRLLKRDDVRAALGLTQNGAKKQRSTKAAPARPAPSSPAESTATTTTPPSAPPPTVMTRDEILALWSSIARGVAMDGVTPLKLGTRDRLDASAKLAKALGVFDPGSRGDEGDVDAPEWAPAVVGAAPAKETVAAPDDVDLNAAIARDIGVPDA